MPWTFMEDGPPRNFGERRVEPTLREMIEQAEALETYRDKLKKEIKDKEDKDKNKKNKVEFPKFTFLETFTLFFLSGFVIGPFVAMYFYMDMMIRLMEKARILGPLLGK